MSSFKKKEGANGCGRSESLFKLQYIVKYILAPSFDIPVSAHISGHLYHNPAQTKRQSHFYMLLMKRMRKLTDEAVIKGKMRHYGRRYGERGRQKQHESFSLTLDMRYEAEKGQNDGLSTDFRAFPKRRN